MRRYSTICPYSSEACTTMNAAWVERDEPLVLSKAFAAVIDLLHYFHGFLFWLRQVRAGDLDDGLPRGFLAGVIVEVWLLLHLDWA
jgi:hypothetical protein